MAAETSGAQTAASLAFGEPGQGAHYRLEQPNGKATSTVAEFTLSFGTNENPGPTPKRWIELNASKVSGEQFRVWLLASEYPPADLQEAKKDVTRYILQEGTAAASEYRDHYTHAAVLPSVGGWFHLVPRRDPSPTGSDNKGFPPALRYLGNRYNLTTVEQGATTALPNEVRVINLLPEVLVGVASNTRQKDEHRRYDDSDYELVRLNRNDYQEMAAAGMTCFKVDSEQLPWIEDLGGFYWGLDGAKLPYPECLYRSTYLGPTLFLDEPAVGTRDYVIRPRLAKDKSFRKNITPQVVFEAFQTHFQQALQEGAPQVLFNSLHSRTDADLGSLQLKQENLFSWETMVSTAAYQLSQDPQVPAAMVFEPPGRIGTWRTLPELDMTYGCQLRVDDPKNLIDIIYGFLRGAARLSNKSWGTSIYGAVDRTDAYWYLSHAYDLGATRFFFWDNAKSACVPYNECLALARSLRGHVENYPFRDLRQLNKAAEVAILLPPGYNLGHVQFGKGNLWGLGELNLERTNRFGVQYRAVMGNFFTEIERCLRLGIAFDLLWDLPGLQPTGYREVIHVREDGKVQIHGPQGELVLDHARGPERPPGGAPLLKVELSTTSGKGPVQVTAGVEVTEVSAPVYYTLGADREGIYHNAYVEWELYGPNEEDYRFLTAGRAKPRVQHEARQIKTETSFNLGRPGTYRLRTATVDLAGRSTVVWRSIVVPQ
jgi:hypothetical protein